MIPPKQTPNEAQRLETLRRYEILDTETEAAFDEIAWLAARVCDTPMAIVSLVDEQRQWFKARIGLEVTQTPRRLSFCGHAIHHDESFVIPNALEDERFRDNPLVLDAPYIRFYAGVPLAAPNGERIGTLCVLDTRPRHLDEGTLRSLRTLSNQVMAQLELRLKSAELRLLGQDTEPAERARRALFATLGHELRAEGGSSATSIRALDHSARRPLEGLRILLAEDQSDLAELMRRHLVSAGADVTMANDGSETLACVASTRASERPVDLILLDMHMPVLNGHEAAAELRRQGDSTLIVALTAGDGNGERELCFASGCDAFLAKPIKRTELILALKTIWDDRREELKRPRQP
jgi:CheY-like chemotaxis protein